MGTRTYKVYKHLASGTMKGSPAAACKFSEGKDMD